MGSALSASQGRSEQITNYLPELQQNYGILATPETVVSSPDSAAARLEGSVQSSINQNIKNVGIKSSDMAGIVSSLAAAIMDQSRDMVGEVADFGKLALEKSNSSEQQLTGIVESIKTPLSKYMPYAVLITVIWLIFKKWK